MATSINDFAFDYEQFDFAHLIAVVPITRSVSLGDITLTLLSLEQYRPGFAANLLFEHVTEPQIPRGRSLTDPLDFGECPLSSPSTTVKPATRAVRMPTMQGAAAAGLPDHFSWRIGCMFGAPIPAGSARLKLAMTMLGSSNDGAAARFVVTL